MELLGLALHLYAVTGFGAFVLYEYLIHKGNRVIRFFSHLMGGRRNRTWARILQEAAFVVVGSFVGTLLMQPVTVQHAFVAGLGWTTLLTQRVEGEE